MPSTEVVNRIGRGSYGGDLAGGAKRGRPGRRHSHRMLEFAYTAGTFVRRF